MVDGSSPARRANTSARTRWAPASSGAAWTASSARWPARRRSPSAASAAARSARTPGAAGQRGQLGGERGVGRRLEVGRVAVVPAAVEAPDVADDELGLVVDGPQVGPFQQLGRRPHGVDDVVEAGALVHQRQRLRRRGARAGPRCRRAPAGCGRPRRSASRGRAAAARARAPPSRAGPPPTPAGSAAPSAGCRSWATPR